MKKQLPLWIVGMPSLILAGVLSGCGAAPATTAQAPALVEVASDVIATPPQPGGNTAGMALTEDYTDAISIRNQLALGTLRLEGTPNAVTTEQAGTVVILWQALRTLQGDSTTAQEELDAVQAQIMETMTFEQVAAIAAMQLTSDDLNTFYAEQGVSLPTPEPGVTPQGGQGSGLSQAEREARRATAVAQGTPAGTGQGQGSIRQTVLLDEVIELLNQRLSE